jgi:ankyrin repeat protein
MIHAISRTIFGSTPGPTHTPERAIIEIAAMCRDAIQAIQWKESSRETGLQFDLRNHAPTVYRDADRVEACERAILAGVDANSLIPLHRLFGLTPKLSLQLLHAATIMGDLPLARLLIKRGASVDTPDSHGRTPLHYGAQLGHIDIIQLLLDNGADIAVQDSSGATALHYTALDSVDACRLLIRNGASPRAVDSHGRTPLHLAAASGVADLIPGAFLTEADLALTDNAGRTPLHEAALGGFDRLCRHLLERGCDIHATDESGRTALHYAIRKGYPPTCATLIKAGADPNRGDKLGITPFQQLVEHGIAVAPENDLLLNTFSHLCQLTLSGGGDPSIKHPDHGESTLARLAANPNALAAYEMGLSELEPHRRPLRRRRAQTVRT